jgi:general secretion pathway protein A
MYESFYGLKEKPFNLTPDPDYIFMSQGHENALIHLEYAITENKGFVVITGEIGSGKTTIINYLLRKIPQDIHIGIINNTLIQPLQFLKMICHEFELQVEREDKTAVLAQFHDFLLEQYSRKRRVVLIVDEAQNLPEVTIEEIRLLSNLEAEKQHLIQIILIGQPQLKFKLQKKSLEQFVQRVTVYAHLYGLDKAEVNEYIRHRLRVAGGENLELFDEGALNAIYKYTHGIPRMVNILCDTALVYGYADDIKIIGKELIESVAEARKIGRGPDPDAPPDTSEMNVVPTLQEMILSDEFEKKLLGMEGRIISLEQEILQITGGMKEIRQGIDERDKFIISLFKLIQKNLNSRSKLLTDFFKQKNQLSRSENSKESKADASHSLFTVPKSKDMKTGD